MQHIKSVIKDSRLAAYAEERAAEVRDIEIPVSRHGIGTKAQPDACAKCGGAGFYRLDVPVGHPQFGKLIPCDCREHERELMRSNEQRSLSNLDHYYDSTFENFDADVRYTRDAFNQAKQYSETFKPIWLVLYGGFGSGKTHLAAAIANVAVQQKMSVLFAVVPDLLDQLRAAYDPKSGTSFDDRFNAIREVGLLVLDDLGTENTTPWAREKLFQIINYRAMMQFPLVVTSNNIRWERGRGLEFAGIDERIASRLSDTRMTFHVYVNAETDYRRRETSIPIVITQRPPRRHFRDQ